MRTRPGPHGFSIVEIVMALGILTLLLAVSVTYFTDMQEDARHKAALAELDAVRGDIQRYQLERRTEYTLRTPPAAANAQDRLDPWFQKFRVDPERHLVYSVGPDGQDQQGEGDDIRLTYDGYTFAELHPPQKFHVAEHGPDWAELRWQPSRYKGGILGYNIFRRESASSSAFSTMPINALELIPDGTEPKYRDDGLLPGKVYYYALEVVAKDGTRASAPAPLGWQIPFAAPPRLSVTPAQVTVASGQAVQFTLVAHGNGSPLQQIKFDGQTFEVNAGEKTLQVSRSFTHGPQKLLAEAFDADGRKAQVDVMVEVK